MKKITNWNGEIVEVAGSRGSGVIGFMNYEDNLVIPGRLRDSNNLFYPWWPYPDILTKLEQSNHIRDYQKNDIWDLRRHLGFYCDLQSVNSEDAITWSVFGSLNCFHMNERLGFYNELLKRIGYEDANEKTCFIRNWQRIGHPDTFYLGTDRTVSHSPGIRTILQLSKKTSVPELDLMIISENFVVFGEAKWGGDIARNQGVNKDKDQLEIRLEYFNTLGKTLFSDKEQVLLFVNIDGEVETKIKDELKIITWAELCNEFKHPLQDELKRYYDFKLNWKDRKFQS